MAGRAQGDPGVPGRWKSAVAKADILAGGRGKAGLVEKVDSVSDAVRALKRLSAAAELKGRLARTSYLVEEVPAKHEVYTAITYDSRFLSPAITLSLRGGMDVESIPETEKRTFPVDVYQGLDAYQAGELLETLDCPRPVISPLARRLGQPVGHVHHVGDEDVRSEPLADHARQSPAGLRLQGGLRRGELQASQPGVRAAGVSGERLGVPGGDGPLERGILPGAGARERPGRQRACCRSCSAAGRRRSSWRR